LGGLCGRDKALPCLYVAITIAIAIAIAVGVGVGVGITIFPVNRQYFMNIFGY